MSGRPLRRVPDERHPARTDGEALRPGPVAQPVSTASSAAFLVAAWWLDRSVRGADGADALGGRLLAAALAANGVGSAGFHGPGDGFSHRLHDASLWAIVGVSGTGALRLFRRGPRGALRAWGWPAALLAGGTVIARGSRTGGRWCRPRSLLQGHAAWHLLAAAGLALAGRRMFGVEPEGAGGVSLGLIGAWSRRRAPSPTAEGAPDTLIR